MKIPVLALLLLTAGTALAGDSGFSAENKTFSLGFEWPWASGGNVENEVNQLYRMLGQVRWQFNHYRSNRPLQRDYWQIRHEADQLNARYKRGDYDHKRMRDDIHGLRVRLQEIEFRLKVKKADLYQWK